MPRNHVTAKYFDCLCGFCSTPLHRLEASKRKKSLSKRSNQTTFYCNYGCAAKARSRDGRTPRKNLIPIAIRFWAKVNKEGPIVRPELGPCWVWVASSNGDGYGSISHKMAHRVSWELHNGPIPSSLCVLHRCDNPPCVRPDHLFLGTKKDNAVDMTTKGRHKVRNVLTQDQVREIRERYQAGGVTQRAIGIEYGVSRWTVGDIIKHRRWVHLS